MAAVNLTADAQSLADVPSREQMPGMHGKFLHSGSMTLVYWDLDEGGSFPEHAHPHEQVVNMLEGELDIVVDGKARHSGCAVTRCRVLDVFSPIREDYRFA